MDNTTNPPKGRQISALARKDSLTPEERKSIAQHGAAARWGKPIIATNRGSFLEELGIDADCYVLNDATRTPVISQRGMAKIIGLSERGNALPRFLNGKAMAEALGAELAAKFANPIKFQWQGGGAEQPTSDINGYDGAMLIDLCNGIVKAGAQLGKRYNNVAKHASIVLAASAKSGIRGLVYALAGYNPSASEVIEAFKLYVQEEAKKYEREFPPELYAAWYRLYQIEPIQGRGRPWEFKHLTVNHIYRPLAQSNGKVLELLRALKASGGDRRIKLFQFLNDIGARALRMQIGRVLEMAEDSTSKQTYEGRIQKRFGASIQGEFDFSPQAETHTS